MFDVFWSLIRSHAVCPIMSFLHSHLVLLVLFAFQSLSVPFARLPISMLPLPMLLS